MAEPSLGYAIGLNVKRQDIFAPAAKQLSQNIATWKAEKAQAKKEKEAQASKAMADIMKYSPDEFHPKARPDATKFFNSKLAKLESMLENPDASSMDYLKLLSETSSGMASFRDQSKGFQDTDQQIRTDARSVPKPIRTFMSTTDLIPTEDQQAAFEIYEAGYDKESGRLLSTGPKMFDVRAEIPAPTEDAMLAAADPAKLKDSQQFIKMKTGYDPLAFTELAPDKIQYLLSLGNVMDRPGALGSITEELIDKKFSGSDDRYYEFLNAEMRKRKDESTDPNAPLPTVKDVAKAAATQYMLDVHFPLYQAANAKILNLNKTPKTGDNSGGKENKADLGAVSQEFQFTTPAAYKAALDAGNKYGLSPEKILAIYSGEDDSATPSQKQYIINSINKFGAVEYAPTVSFQTQGAEKIKLGGESYNVNKMFYNKKDKKFYVVVDKQIPGEGTSINIKREMIKLTRANMKELVAGGSVNTSIKNQLENWDRIAPSNGWPTTSQYSGESPPTGPSGSASTTFDWSGN